MIEMFASPPLHFTSSTEPIFSTSLITFLSCGGTSCPPSFQYALYPLYSLGLCDAVHTTPPWQPRCRIANESSGVGRNASNKKTLIPLAAKTLAVVSAKKRLLFLQSCAIATRTGP